MTPEQAFLVAISEAPQDDTPRLVYADWLEEHNQRDRAEFIRVQCQLAAMGEVKCERTGKPLTAYGEFTDRCRCSSCKVKRREYLCSRRHIEWEWTPEPVIGVYHIFRRGFIASITLASDAFLQHAADIIEAVPMLEEVLLSDCPLVDAGDSRFGFQLPETLWGNPHFAYLRRQFRDEGRAMHALSRYCLAFARERLADRNRLVSVCVPT